MHGISGNLKKKIEKFDADYMHISVEGPLGVTGRHYCLENNIPYTTCIHTKFPEYVYERFGIGLDVTKGLLKWFHNPAAKTLVNTISHKEELEQDGFTDLVLWSRGFDEKIFYPFLINLTFLIGQNNVATTSAAF